MSEGAIDDAPKLLSHSLQQSLIDFVHSSLRKRDKRHGAICSHFTRKLQILEGRELQIYVLTMALRCLGPTEK